MKLTRRILEAIAEMAAGVEAGDVSDYRGHDRPDDRKAYDDALDAGIWARKVLRQREAKRKKASS